MVKIVLFMLTLTGGIFAQTDTLENDCLSCHKAQQIPSKLIYRRYLIKYSTEARIEDAIFSYLKNPQKSTSIMPPQFFLKFPMKEALDLEDERLHKNIKAYLKAFDIKKKLILKK
jgi:hypothetical protein